MDDDDYPTFGNAYPTSTVSASVAPGQASWNPALRPDAEPPFTLNEHHAHAAEADDDFFDRYPGATPEKLRKAAPARSDDLVDTPVAASHRDPFDSQTTRHEPSPHGVSQEQLAVRNIDETPGHHTSSADALDQEAVQEQATVDGQSPEQSRETAAAHYEHQSTISALDAALDESVEAPLISDEQPEPTVVLASEVVAIDSTQDLTNAAPLRSFTTNFTEADQKSVMPQASAPQSDDWPAVGDDKTFAELLDTSPENPAAVSAPAPPSSTDVVDDVSKLTPPDQDVNAAWAAALDDDDILADTDEMDPTSFFGGDDDGFLADEDVDLQPTTALQPVQPPDVRRTVSAYTPVTTTHASPAGLGLVHGRSGGTPDTGLFDLHNFSNQTPIQNARPGLTSTQSFVDKPRSDYQSPYDLPVDVVKPRRRPQPSVIPSQNPAAVPPPRTSSFTMPNSHQSYTAAPSLASSTPPTFSDGPPQPALRSGSGSGSGSGSASSKTADFFADLPVTSKPRQRPVSYSPQPQLHPNQHQPSQAPPQQRSPMLASGATGPPQGQPIQSYTPPNTHQPIMNPNLRQPERAPLFPDHNSESPPKFSPPQAFSATAPNQARYSPVHSQSSQGSTNATRYSPAPADPTSKKATDRYSSSPSSIPQLPPSRQAQPFLPRTSSPLATHGRPVVRQDSFGESDRRGVSQTVVSPERQPLGTKSPERGDLNNNVYRNASPEAKRVSLDISSARPTSSSASTAPRPAYTPLAAHHALSSSQSRSATASSANRQMHLPHRRQFSKDLPYSAPNDERVHDPLQRWKGHAIFHWSNGGLVTSSIPRQTPFYASGSQGPSIKCTPGDIRVTDASQVLSLDPIDAKFPGPLPARAKGRKKDLLAWLSDKIAAMQHTLDSLAGNYELTDEDRTAQDEKLVLWKTMRVFLEHDGVLEGSAKIEEQVRQILLPDLAQKGQVADLQSPTSGPGASAAGDLLDTAVISQIRQALFEGRREHAVRLAEEKRLWGHAMLIASTMDPANFRQIISSFVRSQVKSQGGSEFKSLASLYQVFAGSPEDCVDELVPPSARAGFQMISTTDGRGTGEALGGLDKWRETISLVHSNPTAHNAASILAIGRLLSSYGRVHAAHTCFLFARALAKHSGADDQEADIILFGAATSKGHVDLDALMLTEIYEYASTLSGQANQSQYIPHLQSYKLLHGQMLAAHGLKGQAQGYCDHIDSAIKSTTRPSGYYHQAFAQELIKFNEYLSQSPHVGAGAGGKFFSRPAIGKVSSGVGSWFTKFVSGDEGDTDSNASGQGANESEVFGPFGGVSANSLPISRTGSVADLSGSVPTANGFPTQPSFNMPQSNRYAPHAQSGGSNKYAPMASSASRTSLDSDRSFSLQALNGVPSAEPIRSTSSRYAPTSASHSPALLAVQGGAISRRASNQSLLSTGSYEPRPALAEHDGFGYSQDGDAMSAVSSQPEHRPDPETSPFQSQEPVREESYENNSHDDAEGGQSYMPPTMSYEPPTYSQPDDEDVGASTSTIKKKSFMDDDEDDLVRRAAALKISKPQTTSRDPDPAIVAAAAAEAAKDAQSKDKRASGWFGGWFGKKDGEGAPGPIKAKLGEESSFYFDKDLNKWVNKKAGPEALASAAPTPPPPRAPTSSSGTPLGTSAPPSRTASNSLPPANAPPSRQGTPASVPPLNGIQPRSTSSGSAVTDSGLGSMGPPPRPSSSMSTATNLDDLLGGPGGGRKSGAKAKKKGGRYVDVMANAK